MNAINRAKSENPYDYLFCAAAVPKKKRLARAGDPPAVAIPEMDSPVLCVRLAAREYRPRRWSHPTQ